MERKAYQKGLRIISRLRFRSVPIRNIRDHDFHASLAGEAVGSVWPRLSEVCTPCRAVKYSYFNRPPLDFGDF